MPYGLESLKARQFLQVSLVNAIIRYPQRPPWIKNMPTGTTSRAKHHDVSYELPLARDMSL